ncbi:hypothetical protein [Flavobacterium sp. CS20]|uniref:hypothetical protein n=1 Tax=Flavobacterium sp. CS20 TaxID=2775246 RepID=UPI001FFD4CD7|nr:hypothetical protein [Flavobacterium sp. CS20]
MGWGLSNTLGAQASIEVVKQAIKTNGRYEILNSDQGTNLLAYNTLNYLKRRTSRSVWMVKEEL